MPSRYERALARTDAQARQRAQKHMLPPSDATSLDALCPAAAPPRPARADAVADGVADEAAHAQGNPREPPTPSRPPGEARLPVLGARAAVIPGQPAESPRRRRGSKGQRAAGRSAVESASGATPKLPARSSSSNSSSSRRGDAPAPSAGPDAEPTCSGEWSAIVRAAPRRRTGPSRRSAEAGAAGGRDSATPPPEDVLLSPAAAAVGQRGQRRSSSGPTPALQVSTDGPAVDTSSSGEFASLIKINRQIDFRQARGDFSPPVTPASELREGSAEDFDAAEQAEWRDCALPKVGGTSGRRSVGQWRTDVVDIQAQLDSLESLPYSIHELKLDGSTVHGEGGSADAAWHVAEEDR
jgi:hypothetical protein